LGVTGVISWIYIIKIKASNSRIDDLFGSSVVLIFDGKTLVVNATGEASTSTNVINNNIIPDTNNTTAGAGVVYLY